MALLKKRNITVVTGTRAEYGILRPVMEAIAGRKELRLQLLATGMHLLRRFGMTVREIEADGWRIDARVRLQGADDDPVAQSVGLGRAISKMSTEFARLRSDVVLVLGDRIEVFAAAAAAVTSGRLLAHIHGGDVAPGVQDDAYRHAVSKLAHLHFVATEGAKKRLLAMGEQPFRIKLTGSPALDGIKEIMIRDAEELSRQVGLNVREEFLIVAQHPAGFAAAQEKKYMQQTLRACEAAGKRLIVMYPNSDPGFSGIAAAAEAFCRRTGHPLIKNLPRPVFLGLLKRCRTLVGNSSAGLVEGGYLGVSVLNIGPRQAGRECGANVTHVAYGEQAVRRALQSLLRRKHTIRPVTLYSRGNAARKIAEHLTRIELNHKLYQKHSAF